MRAEEINPYPLNAYDRVFRHQAIFQPQNGDLIQVSILDLAEIAAAVDENEGKLYSFYWGAGIRHVQDMAHLREINEIPNPDGWRRAVAILEQEKATTVKVPTDYDTNMRYRQLLTREEHKFTVSQESEGNYFDSACYSFDDFESFDEFALEDFPLPRL